jgi:hypothetical protein
MYNYTKFKKNSLLPGTPALEGSYHRAVVVANMLAIFMFMENEKGFETLYRPNGMNVPCLCSNGE